MKKISVIIFILLFTVCSTAQKKVIKKPTKKAKKTRIVQDNITIVDGVVDDGQTIQDVQTAPFVIDTLFINYGKAYVFLVDVKKYDVERAQMVGEEPNDEEKELLQNFKKDAFEIKKINKQVLILLENKQTLDVSGLDNSYQAFAYWGGKENDKVQVQEGSKKRLNLLQNN